jgi:hypothetical protein
MSVAIKAPEVLGTEDLTPPSAKWLSLKALQVWVFVMLAEAVGDPVFSAEPSVCLSNAVQGLSRQVCTQLHLLNYFSGWQLARLSRPLL